MIGAKKVCVYTNTPTINAHGTCHDYARGRLTVCRTGVFDRIMECTTGESCTFRVQTSTVEVGHCIRMLEEGMCLCGHKKSRYIGIAHRFFEVPELEDHELVAASEIQTYVE